MKTEERPYPLDRLALGLSLSGVVLGVLIAIGGRLNAQDFTMHGYGVFVAFSVAAIVLGIITRTSAIGRTALITSSILLVGSLGMLA
ncbi:hypothetical protein [Botrimarina mediterranea]|uniref:Uncharacterized protein n=1 Tax=Botrimarina mediterranea TaxID=2528022 RepID=A0A518KB39_9BACT|nr:hypothetical protein [Botrimarina mediterranea]QDV75012.1 hypothetical protein Spa11_32210 [Botrimarina mediterranea]QDV79659.1 hypothetical protein K2D_32740 [Planctomycetes bacterium K2D]